MTSALYVARLRRHRGIIIERAKGIRATGVELSSVSCIVACIEEEIIVVKQEVACLISELDPAALELCLGGFCASAEATRSDVCQFLVCEGEEVQGITCSRRTRIELGV